MSTHAHKRVLAYLTWSTPALWHGVRAFAREAGWVLVSPNHAHGPPSHLFKFKFDGVLALVAEYEAFDVRQSFRGAKVVDLQDTTNLVADAKMTVDHEAIGTTAANYLAELGYQRFVALRLNVRIHTLEKRLKGFAARVKDLGRELAWLDADFWMPAPEALLVKIKKVLAVMEIPVAVFSPDDNMADLFIQAALELGYRVPEDIAVLSSNNDRSVCEMCRVTISSIDVNFSRLGYESARVLDRLMNGLEPERQTAKIPPLAVVKRRSTESAFTADPLVNAIQEYIGEHYAEQITADDIVKDIHSSRSVAYKRFSQVMGHSIGKEIERARMRQAQSLLSGTDFKIDVVARLSGYTNTSAFCRAFKSVFAKTPSEMRTHKS